MADRTNSIGTKDEKLLKEINDRFDYASRQWRDIREDSRAGISTLSARIGRRWAHYGYVALVLGAYMVLALSVIASILPASTMLAILSLPFLAQVIRSAELGATGQARAIAMIDLQTARLHLAFGLLLVVGLIVSRLVGG